MTVPDDPTTTHGPPAPAPGDNQPTLLDMVHDLHRAVYGDTWARSMTPKAVWEMLLAEVVAAVRDAQHLSAATAALHALHHSDGSQNPWCDHDGFAWPCPTIRALAETMPQ